MDKFEVFLNALNDSTRSPEEIDSLSKAVLTEYNVMNEKLSLDINKICYSIGRWLKSNFSSRFIPFAFRLMINLYQQLGFSLEFDVQDYYKTSDKLDEKDPKALGKSDLEGFEDDKDTLVENPLLSSEVIQVILSLIENMVSQKKHIANKNLLILVLPVLSIYSADKRVQNIIRKKKFLKMILQIFKDIVESTQTLTEIDIQICSYLLHTTAKLTYHNKKNQDYLIKKKGYEYIKGVIATSQDLVLLQGAICTFANLAETSDGRLVLWCSGNLPFLTQRIKVALTNIKKYLNITQRKTSTFNHALRDLELCLIALWKISAGTDEVIEECFRNAQLMKNFEEIMELMDAITPQDPQYLSYIKCIGVCIAIIRRFCSSTKFRQAAIERFIRFIYKLPKIYGDQISYAKESHSFMLKELAGLVGVVCLDRAMIESLVSNGMVKEILKIGIAYFDSPRLIKTVLGFLTNINTVDEIRDTLSKDKEIYILLYNILDKYDYSNLIMDYAIKLILNTCQNELFFRNYTAPRFLEKFVYIFHVYLEDDLITSNMIKLFRILSSKVKSLESFVASVKDYEIKMQHQFDFISALVENIRIDDYQIAIDTILLISTLSQNSDVLKNKIRENKKIVAFMNAFINYYKDKPDVFKLVSSSLACLPLEELNAFI